MTLLHLGAKCMYGRHNLERAPDNQRGTPGIEMMSLILPGAYWQIGESALEVWTSVLPEVPLDAQGSYASKSIHL